MAFAEDLGLFLYDFGRACTLAGGQVTAMVNTEGFEDPTTGVITEGPSALLPASAAAAGVPGATFVDGSVTYTVRQKLPEPPDGAFVRLVLART